MKPLLYRRWGWAPRDRAAGPDLKLLGAAWALRAWVVSGPRKGGEILRQVWTRKANESEPLMRRRKGMSVIETRIRMNPRDKARKGPVYGPGGDRRRSGASRVQALVWNVGTERPDAKGEVRGDEPRRASVPMRDDGADRSVVAMKPGNAGGAKGTGLSCFKHASTLQGGGACV
jgi:hypothetical protein